jgi:hypothetical protein
MSTEHNNARFSANLSEQHADKVIAYAIRLLTEDVKSELHDAQIYSIEGNDLETAKRLKLKQEMVAESVKNLKRLLLK